eukprot:339164_1
MAVRIGGDIDVQNGNGSAAYRRSGGAATATAKDKREDPSYGVWEPLQDPDPLVEQIHNIHLGFSPTVDPHPPRKTTPTTTSTRAAAQANATIEYDDSENGVSHYDDVQDVFSHSDASSLYDLETPLLS